MRGEGNNFKRMRSPQKTHPTMYMKYIVYIKYILYLCTKYKKIMTSLAFERKRKNIDLPVETLQKLSIMAAAQGKSLKAFIEHLLMAKAESLEIEVSTNPSPSDDPWFDIPENIASVKRGIEDAKKGKVKTYTIDEIRKLLGV